MGGIKGAISTLKRDRITDAHKLTRVLFLVLRAQGYSTAFA
jgi:hypothetical protein